MADLHEHKRRAEELLHDSYDDQLFPDDVRDRMIARAQVHATLYLGDLRERETGLIARAQRAEDGQDQLAARVVALEDLVGQAEAEKAQLAAFVDRLRELMFVGGQNGEIVRRWALQAFAEFDAEDPS